MTFVLIVMALAVVGVLAAVRLVYTTQDFNDLDSRPAEVPARAREGGTDAGWEDPASVPEAFTTAPRGCVASHSFPPVGRDAANTLDEAMAAWDAEWLWPPSPDPTRASRAA